MVENYSFLDFSQPAASHPLGPVLLPYFFYSVLSITVIPYSPLKINAESYLFVIKRQLTCRSKHPHTKPESLSFDLQDHSVPLPIWLLPQAHHWAIRQLPVSRSKNLNLSSRHRAPSSASLCFQRTLKLFDHTFQENLSSSLFSHINTSHSTLSQILHSTSTQQWPQCPQSQRWTTKDQRYLFHFSLLTLIHSKKANKQFYAMQRFYPYKAFNLVSGDAPLALQWGKGNSTKITADRTDLKSSVSVGKEQEQQLLDTSNIFFSRDETIMAKLSAMLLFL